VLFVSDASGVRPAVFVEQKLFFMAALQSGNRFARGFRGSR
jgi:hypothetical protein